MLWSEGYCSRKGHVEGTRTAWYRNMVYCRQDCISGKTAEIIGITVDSKCAEVMIPKTSPFNSPIWPLQKTYASWRTKARYYKCTINVILFAVGFQMQSLPCTNSDTSANLFAATDTSKTFYPYLLVKITRICLISIAKAIKSFNVTFQKYVSSVVLCQPSVQWM